MNQDAIAKALAQTSMFGDLEASDLVDVVGRMRRIQFEVNQMIFSRGDAAREMFFVLEGRVRLSVLSLEGRELSFAHAGPGELFGEIATLDGGERTASATAIGAVTAMALPQRALMDLIDNNTHVAKAVIQFLCQRLRDTDQKLEAIALHRIEVRLARLMLSAIKLQGGGNKDGQAKLDLGLSQSEIGLLIGASRPKVNLALTALEDMGAISRAGAAYKCDLEVLTSIADAESA